MVEDLLPAGLEFLGCGVGDNTTDAPTNSDPGSPEEYEGSGGLNVGGSPEELEELCEEPDIVETVEADPDGDGSDEVYTRVVWNEFGEILKGAKRELRYVAAIPIRENTMTWTGSEPAVGSGLQASNLDNNSGDETVDEQPLTNFATVFGEYNGTLQVEAENSLTRAAEDLAVWKEVKPTTILQGQLSRWTLHIGTSEYRYVDDITVEDTVPDGLCPLGAENFENPNERLTECDGDGLLPEQMPSHAYSVPPLENEDGTFTVVWSGSTGTVVPELARMGPSEETTISYPTRTRTSYQEEFQSTTPVLAEDSWRNHVEIEGPDFRICAPGDPLCQGAGTKIEGDEPEGTPDKDESEAEQRAEPVELDKMIAERSGEVVDCQTETYIEGPESYAPGDIVCWKLHVAFPGQLDTGDVTITDFLPPGSEYVANSAEKVVGEDSGHFSLEEFDAEAGALTWKPEEADEDVEPDVVFSWVLATRVNQTPETVVGDLKGNLMKLSYENTPGQSFPLRDEAKFSHSQARVELEKGIAEVNETPVPGGPLADDVLVNGGDKVTYNIRIENTGDLGALDIEVWDELEDGIVCEDVENISMSGECEDSRIVWTGLALPPLGEANTLTLEYDVVMPSDFEPEKTVDNHAGVVSYESETNTETDFKYIPVENIDEEIEAESNATKADDPSSVHMPEIEFEKTHTTEINEAHNSASQATIGEQINYVVKLTIPEGTTVYGAPLIHDLVAPRQTLLSSPEPEVTLNGGEAPAQFELSSESDNLLLQFPQTYENDPGDGPDVFEVTFSTQIRDIEQNSREPNFHLPNTAVFEWQLADETEREAKATTTTTIVEPVIDVEKTHDVGGDVVEPGDPVVYTLKATNPVGTRISTAHDLVLEDVIPPGMKLIGTPAGTPTIEGSTIRWTIAELKPGESAQRSYEVEVEDPATAGETFTNGVLLTATSMPGEVSDERGPESTPNIGYTAEDQKTVRLGDATLTKGAEPAQATIGQEVTYTLETTFPAHVDYFDATVLDTLPDGIAFEETVETSCNGGACTPAVEEIATKAGTSGATRLAWFLGDVIDHTEPLTVKVVYTAYVEDEYEPEATKVLSGQQLTNDAVTRYNGEDKLSETPSEVPDEGDFAGGSNSDEATVTVIEPKITLDKKVSGDADEDDFRTTVPGDSYTYSLVIRNTGNSPAYDIEVADTPDNVLLEAIKATEPAPAGVKIEDGNGDDGSLEWLVEGPLLPNQSVTLTYTAELAPSALLKNGAPIDNTAGVPLYWGLDETDRGEHPPRAYEEAIQDTVMLEVNVPLLQLSKKVGATGSLEVGDAEINQPFTWWIQVSNVSPAASAKALVVTDQLPVNWEYVPGSSAIDGSGVADPEIDEETPSGDTLTWNVGNLGPNSSRVLTFQAKPTPAVLATPGVGPSEPNENEARVTGADSSDATESQDGPYEAEDEAAAIVLVPELTIEKTPDEGEINAGESGQYTIVVSNEGEGAARGVEVTDALAGDQTYVAGTATVDPPTTGFNEQAPVTGPGGTAIVWEIDEIPAGQSVTITLPFLTDPGLDDGTALVNDASARTTEVPDEPSDEGDFEVHVAADVSIEKQTLTDPVVAGEDVEFKLTVENHGPSDATGVKVEDTLPSYLQLTFVDPACTQDGNGIDCELGELEVNETVEVIVKATVSPDQVGQIENTATVTTTSPDPELDNNEAATEPPLLTDANLTVLKRGPADPVLREEVFEYEIEVTNTGVSTAVDVEMTDELPAGVTFVAEGQEAAACEESGGVVTCSWEKLDPDETKVVTFEVKSTEVGERVNTAVVSTESTETNPNDNEAEFPVTVVEPEITIDKKVSGDPDEDDFRTTVPGDPSYTYSLVVRNTGTGTAYDIEVVDTPDNARLQSIEATVEPAGVKIEDGNGNDGTLKWLVESLAPGASVTIEYTAELASSTALETDDEIVNVAHVPVYWGVPDHESSVPPATPYNDDPQDSVTLEVFLPEPALEKKVGPTGGAEEAAAEVGVPFTWWIEVSNDSTLADAQAIQVSDVLPANWEYVTGSTEVDEVAEGDPTVGQGTPPVGDTLTWTGLPDLPAGTSFVLTFEARPTAAAGQVPGHGGANPNVNQARVTGEDSGGFTEFAAGPYEAEDQALAILELPALNITKTPDDGDVDAGGEAAYTVLVENEGIVPARDVVVTDVLGAGQIYLAGSAIGNPATGFSERPPTGGPPGPTTIVWDIVEILPGESVEITVPFDTDQGLSEGAQLDNHAEVVSREITTPVDDDGGYEAHVSADVEIEKSTVTGELVAGENVEYTLTVRNLGPSNATGVEVEDALPGYLEFVSAENPCADTGGGLVKCPLGNLAANGEVELTLIAKVDPAQTADVVNTAKVTSTSPDPNEDNDEETVEDPVTVNANVKVEKSGPAAPVLQGSTFSYDIVVSNTDVSTAVNVELIDQLPSQVTFLNILAGPCTESGGTVTCNWATLAPGESDTVTIEVEAVEVAPEPGVVNDAVATTESPETNPSDNEDEAPVVILPMADLAVVKSAPETVAAGSELTYDVKVTNEGPSKATGVVATDALPAGVVYVSSEPECTHAAHTVTCQAGDLEPSESRDFKITVAVPHALAEKTLTNIVAVDGNEGDLVNGNNTDEAETKVGPAADIFVSKTAGGATAGGTAGWTILVENKGPSAAPVKVSDLLPAGTTLRSATPSQGSCSANGNEAVCDLGILHSGASAQISVLADVAAGSGGRELRNHAKAHSPHPDPDPTNNESEAVNQVKDPPQTGSATGPQLRMSKTAGTSQPELGKPLSYKLVISNDGSGDAHKVKVTDTMNRDVEVRQVDPSKGKCSESGSRVTCSLGTFPAHQQATVNVVVVPISPGGLRNTASVSSADGEREMTDNLDVAGVRVGAPRAGVKISKRALRKSVRGGQNVSFRIVLKVGRRAVADVTVCDRLPAGLVFVKVPRARLRGGNACWQFPYLAAGARKTMKVVARADRGFSVKRVRNVAVVKGANASRARATAPLRIAPAYAGAPGGVTG